MTAYHQQQTSSSLLMLHAVAQQCNVLAAGGAVLVTFTFHTTQ